jgi:hypothetical protein
LADLKSVFAGSESMSTAAIVERLAAMEESPWGNLRGFPIDARKLATFLKPYKVKSQQIRHGGTTLKGYRAEDLFDAWQRYLPDTESVSDRHGEKGKHPKQPLHDNEDGGSDVSLSDRSSETLPISETLPKQEKPINSGIVADVSDVSDFRPDRDGHGPPACLGCGYRCHPDTEGYCIECRPFGSTT